MSLIISEPLLNHPPLPLFRQLSLHTVVWWYSAPRPDGLLDKAAGYRSLLDIQARGKWRATQSVLRYEKHARIAQQLERLGPAVLQDLRSREACLPSAFSASFGRR